MSFSDIGRNGYSRPPQLTCQSIQLRVRKCGCRPVALFDEIHCLPPRFEITICKRCRHAPPSKQQQCHFISRGKFTETRPSVAVFAMSTDCVDCVFCRPSL